MFKTKDKFRLVERDLWLGVWRGSISYIVDHSLVDTEYTPMWEEYDEDAKVYGDGTPYEDGVR